MKIAQDWLFSTPVMEVDFEETEFDNSKYVEVLLNKIDLKFFEIESSLTTDDNLFTLSLFKPLIELIDKKVKIYTETMHIVDFSTIKMTAMWANIHKGRSMHILHMHANSFISGVFYLYVPENFINLGGRLQDLQGKISFEDPRDARHIIYPDYINPCLWETALTWNYTPKTNKLILFPGYLRHHVHDFHTGNDYRISISFNYMITSSKASTRSFNLNS